MRKQSVAALIGSVLVFGLIVPGCGGGSSGSGSTAGNGAASGEASSIEKAAFVKRANAICNAAKKKIESEYTKAAQKAQSENLDENQIGAILTGIVVDNLQSRVDELRALGLPAEDGEEAEAIREQMQEQVEEAKAAPKAFVVSKEEKRAVDAPAKEYGLTDCTLAWL